MYENSCYGVKCTDLAKNLIFALETSVEWGGYYFQEETHSGWFLWYEKEQIIIV
jgi:hypothetical protein